MFRPLLAAGLKPFTWLPIANLTTKRFENATGHIRRHFKQA
jgi:hypothetical protein